MRTLFSLFTAASMLAATTIALSGGVANADPYPGTIDTTCHAKALNNPKVGKAAKVRFRVSTNGNGAPHGAVTFSYTRQGNGKTVAVFTRDYDGKNDYSFRDLPRGKYDVKVRFNSQPNKSVYQNCRTSFAQQVRPRH